MATQSNKKRLPADVDVGDEVWLSSANLNLPPSLSRKLAARWIGPFKVLAKVGAAAFKLDLPKELSRLHPVFHVSLLKKVHGEPIRRAPVFTDDSDVAEYEVEKVLARRLSGRTVEYLIL